MNEIRWDSPKLSLPCVQFRPGWDGEVVLHVSCEGEFGIKLITIFGFLCIHIVQVERRTLKMLIYICVVLFACTIAHQEYYVATTTTITATTITIIAVYICCLHPFPSPPPHVLGLVLDVPKC